MGFFDHHPVTGTATLRSGTVVPNTYHARSAQALVLHGTARADEAARLLAGTGLTPITTDKGDAIAQLWVMRYEDTNIGPYSEVVVALAASRTKNPKTTFSKFTLPTLPPTGSRWFRVDFGAGPPRPARGGGVGQRTSERRTYWRMPPLRK